MTNLLVTGGAGFIGANFVHYWRQHHPQDGVVVLDALTYAGNRANLDGLNSVEFVHGDIRDTALVEKLLADHAIDTIVHFAAESHVDRSIHGPAAFVDTNVIGTLSLLMAARAAWLSGSGVPHRFHHVSTDEVYGTLGPNDPAFSETTAYAPNSPYSASKAASDHLVRAWHHTYGLPTIVSNTVNNYGPWQFPEKLIPLVTLNALEGKPLPVYGDGSNMRDWLFVDDHAEALLQVATKGQPGGTYGIGARQPRTNLQVVHAICAALDARVPDPAGPRTRLITFVTDRPGHDFRYEIDPSRAEAALSWTAPNDFDTGLGLTVDWYLANRAWWEKIRAARYAGQRLGQAKAEPPKSAA